ncbi:hypothetical protein DOTSEDRAFT_68854 [Dothistroma septosporum NZE10]|uniref:DAGKc domain-containing protein n=1 Tax=Dothistroma septosporum (strain NZE10 / CBS 128990) TaxID=675120 RepID=N1Q375_DOTSN|nr:hypothetical protein DOTSEDRAFT_68854 [Dothistroma septosporum NZE10]
MASPSDTSNPFEDPAGSEASLDVAAVLTVDRNATLTLGTDALIVLDEGLRHRRAASNCCGLLPQLAKTTRAVPFHNVLWAEFGDFDVAVRYAQSVGRKGKGCRVDYVTYQVTDKSLHGHAKAWAEKLMERAYPPSTRRKLRIKVLVNPFGGQGYAQKIWTREIEPILAAAHCELEVERTMYRGHAVEIAEKLNIEAFDVIACASGDGLPHEVFNGLARRKDAKRALKKIAVCQMPCGSGNAMSLNMLGADSPSLAAVEMVKGIRTPLDLVAITQGSNTLYSFLSQAVGIIAEADLGTESLRWMGSLRFTWGFLVRLLGKTIYPAEISVVVETDDKRQIRESYRHAREEFEAARSKQLHRSSSDEGSHLAADDVALPPLNYGTVLETLHHDFVTQDIPNLGNFYTGNMCYMSPDTPFFAAALPSDGLMDMVTIPGDIPRTTALRMLTTIEKGTLLNFPEVTYRKVLAYRITPRQRPEPVKGRFRAKLGRWLGGASKQQEGLIAIDGERVPFEAFQAEVVPALGMTLSKSGGLYEYEGPKGP